MCASVPLGHLDQMALHQGHKQKHHSVRLLDRLRELQNSVRTAHVIENYKQCYTGYNVNWPPKNQIQ